VHQRFETSVANPCGLSSYYASLCHLHQLILIDRFCVGALFTKFPFSVAELEVSSTTICTNFPSFLSSQVSDDRIFRPIIQVEGSFFQPERILIRYGGITFFEAEDMLEAFCLFYCSFWALNLSYEGLDRTLSCLEYLLGIRSKHLSHSYVKQLLNSSKLAPVGFAQERSRQM
jgi:hypothetical protein